MGNLYCCEELIYVWEFGFIDLPNSFPWPRLQAPLCCPPAGKQVSPSLFIPVVEQLKATSTGVSFHSKCISPRIKSVENFIPTLQGLIHFHVKGIVKQTFKKIFFCFHRHYQVLRTDFISALINEYMSGMHNKEFFTFLDDKNMDNCGEFSNCHVLFRNSKD